MLHFYSTLYKKRWGLSVNRFPWYIGLMWGKSKLLICLGIFALGLVLGVLIGSKTTVVSSPPSSLATTNDIIPECLLGLCPEYISMDVDEDDLAESVVIIPTAMTQGAGKVWIIDDGKKVFDSGEFMRINVFQKPEQSQKGSGFTLLYGTEINSSDNAKEVTFEYLDGSFRQIN